MTFSEYLEVTTKYGITFYHMLTEEEIKSTSKKAFDKKLLELTNILKGVNERLEKE